MGKKKRRSFGEEFKLEAVKLVTEGGMSINRAALDLGIHATSLRLWVQQYNADHGKGPAGAMTSQEKEELRRLRRENRELRMEREVLKKATVFFAKENE